MLVEEGRELATEFNILFMETSAKSNENGCLQTAFKTIIGMAAHGLIKEKKSWKEKRKSC